MGGKIIGGHRVSRMEERPYVVSLRKYNVHFGIGTLISSIHSLTAAHIVLPHTSQNHNYTGMTVVAGSLKLDNSGVHRSLMYIEVHPNFRENPGIVSPYNIALVTVSILHDNYEVCPESIGPTFISPRHCVRATSTGYERQQ